jgi:hypothetical protein
MEFIILNLCIFHKVTAEIMNFKSCLLKLIEKLSLNF